LSLISHNDLCALPMIKLKRVRPNDGTNAKFVVPPELSCRLLTKIPVCDATGKASFTLSDTGVATDTLAL
jgi:hypothetical protein